MRSSFRLSAVALLASMMGSVSSGAYTYIAMPGVSDPGPVAGELRLVDFDSPIPPGYTVTGDYGLGVDTLPGSYQAPAGDASVFFYTSPSLPTSSATLLTIDMANISFYWGSIEADNVVDVLNFYDGTVLTITGAEILQGLADAGATQDNARITIFAQNDEYISGLRFRTTNSVFEVDDVTGNYFSVDNPSVVPEPAIWALTIGGFGLVGARCRRGRRLNRAQIEMS